MCKGESNLKEQRESPYGKKNLKERQKDTRKMSRKQKNKKKKVIIVKMKVKECKMYHGEIERGKEY